MVLSAAERARVEAEIPLLLLQGDLVDEVALAREVATFLQSAFPEEFASLKQAALHEWIGQALLKARQNEFSSPLALIYWVILAALAGNEFSQGRFTSLWLGVRYLTKEDLLERLLLGMNVTLRSPHLAVLTNSYETVEQYENGAAIHEDGLGRK